MSDQNGHERTESAASTLVASGSSSKAHSLDEDRKVRKYDDIELDRFDERQRKRRKSSHDGTYDSDGGEGTGEGEHLLAYDTVALNETTGASVAQPDEAEPPPPADAKDTPVSWSSLPKKGQLAILTLARLSEPLAQTSLQAYMFYQLKSFKLADGSEPSDATVARQAGVLAAAFTGAQMLTAMIWGRLADSTMMGRKRVILVGLFGTAVGSLGFGFSSNFATAVCWRAIGGVLNGNIGVMRTMISEIVKEKKFMSRAFLLLPMTFNIGVIIGPLLGGLLADPVGSYPAVFGPGGSIGGEDGVGWLMRYPYALPNVVNAVFLLCSSLGVLFGLEETLEALKDKPDYPLKLSRWILRVVYRRRPSQEYSAIGQHDRADDVELQSPISKASKPTIRRKLPFRRIWTRNVLWTLLSHGLLAMHLGTFSNLWFVFLSTPRYNPHWGHQNSPRDGNNKESLQVPPHYQPHAPFTFTGGLALPPPSIGTALAILGVLGITMQLVLFPRVSLRLGTVTALRWSLRLFPIGYTLAPFLAVIPASLPPPAQAGGFLVWLGITVVLIVQVTARTFALPSNTILVNNSSPHPSVLGTVHGIAQSVSSATRTLGPVLGGYLYGVGLSHGIVGIAWWSLAGLAIVGAVAGQFVREGDGHEIWLEGEQDEEESKS